MGTSYRFKVTSEQEGLRLDQAINAGVPAVSRTLAKRLLAQGGVYLERHRVKVAGRLVSEGQLIEVHLIDAQKSGDSSKQQTAPLVIVERGKGWLVVNKPSGIFSAPTRQSDRGDVLDLLRGLLSAQGEEVPPLHLVHRLDRPTSGLMVVATSKDAARTLSEQLANRSMKRIYQAALVGELQETRCIDEAIDEKNAVTTFTPLKVERGLSLIQAELTTGRTHQVRIHAEMMKMPVAGDSKYGRGIQRRLSQRPPRLALHACELRFMPPGQSKARVFLSPLPQELSEWFAEASAEETGARQDVC